MRENENEKSALDEEVKTGVAEPVEETDTLEVEDAEEIDPETLPEVDEVEDRDENEQEAPKGDNSIITMTVFGTIALIVIIAAACLFTSEARTKQLNLLLGKISSLEEQVATLQEAEDKDIIKSYKGVVEGVSSVTEKGKTKYYVEISSAGKFEISQSIYEEIEDFVGCIVNWYEHTTFDAEGAKIIWYNYDIDSVG